MAMEGFGEMTQMHGERWVDAGQRGGVASRQDVASFTGAWDP